MTDADALLRAVIEAPDDAPRLIYADWLDEHGESERAELIRIQIAAARAIAAGTDPGQYPHLEKWMKRERDLIRHRWQEWYPDGITVFVPPAPVLPPNHPSSLIGTVARGFIQRVEGPAADWITHADHTLAAHPVTEVRLTTRPEIDFRLIEGAGCVRLRGSGQWYGPDERWAGMERLRAADPSCVPTDFHYLLAERWSAVKKWRLPPGDELLIIPEPADVAAGAEIILR